MTLSPGTRLDAPFARSAAPRGPCGSGPPYRVNIRTPRRSARKPDGVRANRISTPSQAGRELAACGELCTRVHGHDRNGEVREAIAAGTARVVDDRICGYASGFGYGRHAVAETNDDLATLLGSADTFMGLGILVPSRNAGLLRWCLGNGLRIVEQSTLMTIGLYNEPAGAWLPSIVF